MVNYNTKQCSKCKIFFDMTERFFIETKKEKMDCKTFVSHVKKSMRKIIIRKLMGKESQTKTENLENILIKTRDTEKNIIKRIKLNIMNILKSGINKIRKSTDN